jgi:hypothetical protein
MANVEKYYDDWGPLVAAANRKTKTILETDVAPVAEDILKRHIRDDIYGAYRPKTNGWVDEDGHRATYERRNDLSNKVTSVFEQTFTGTTITVTSTEIPRHPVRKGFAKTWWNHNRTTGSLLQLLESGNMGIWRGGFARPAVSNTQEAFETDRRINAAIKRGVTREIGKSNNIT